MRVLLIDADSKIPNIALMKLSTYHKSLGDTVDIYKCDLPYYPQKKKQVHSFYFLPGLDYDKIYCSVIFEGNKEYIQGDNIVFGGTGHDLKTVLPVEVEACECDYGLYPENDISYGFITRGCIRKCAFCKVPEKEGYIRKVNEIDDIVRHKRVKFLDNNILAYSGHREILEELVRRKIQCDFTQGLDIRLIDEENSLLLSKLRYFGAMTFAFDDIGMKNLIDSKLQLLKWRRDWGMRFFVYTHPDMCISDVLTRVLYLRHRKCLPYLMRDIACFTSENKDFYTDLSSWCNQVRIYMTFDFEGFVQEKHKNNLKRRDRSLELWREHANFRPC